MQGRSLKVKLKILKMKLRAMRRNLLVKDLQGQKADSNKQSAHFVYFLNKETYLLNMLLVLCIGFFISIVLR